MGTQILLIVRYYTLINDIFEKCTVFILITYDLKIFALYHH
jgi:hypothetical protein